MIFFSIDKFTKISCDFSMRFKFDLSNEQIVNNSSPRG